MLKTINGDRSTKCINRTMIHSEVAVINGDMKLGPVMRFQSFLGIFIILGTSDVNRISLEVSHVIGELIVFKQDRG